MTAKVMAAVRFDRRKAIQKATSLIQQGRMDKAIEEYEAILRADPSDPSLYNTLGDLYAQIGSTSEAVASYLKLVEALRAEGFLYRAIAVYKKIIRLDPNNLDALLTRADLYAEEGLRAEARHQYLLAAERSLKLGFVKRALEMYERLTRLEPGDASIAAKLASLLAREGRRSEAADLLGRLAQEIRGQGRLDDARLLYQQMVEIDPGTFTGWYWLGRIELDTARFEEAETHLRRAAEIEAGSPLPYLLLGHLYEQQMQPDRAKAAWLGLLRQDPDHQEAHQLLGRLYLKEGDTEAAAREFDIAVRSLHESRELNRAISLLREFVSTADHPLIQERLGELLGQSGRSSEATAAYGRAAALYLASGKVEERRRMLSLVLTLDPGNPEAVAGLTAGAPVLEGSVTVVREAGEPEAQLVMNDPPQVGGETRWTVDQTDQEGFTILTEDGESGDEVAEACAIVNLHVKRRMDAEARAILRRLIATDPENAEASRYLASLESKALTNDGVIPEFEVVQSDPAIGSEDARALTTLLAEMEQHGGSEELTELPHAHRGGEKALIDPAVTSGSDLSATEPLLEPLTSSVIHPLESSGGPPLDDRSPEACEAHYQLGLAYREMSLLDDAIAEFRRAAADEQLRLPACHMLGLCLLAKGDVEAALHELGRGLSTVGRPAEEYLEIKYDIATAYQSIGDLASAEATLEALHAESPSFRDVRPWLMKLRARPSHGPGPPGASKGRIDAAKRPQSG